MRFEYLASTNNSWSRVRLKIESGKRLRWFAVLRFVWGLAGVLSQDTLFGLDAALSAQSVHTTKGLADAWANPVVRTALVHGELTLDQAPWRQFFSATGGVPALAVGPNDVQRNFTIAGGWPCSDGDQCSTASSDSPATINFKRLPYTFMVGSRGVLQFQNMMLYDIALSADYQYSPQQPYKALVVGSSIWPTVGLAPGAVVKLVNVSVAYRNTDPEMSCEQRVALGIYSLRQLRGTNVITWRNSTAGWVPGVYVSTLDIVNGSNNAPLGNATFHVQNVTWSCLPSLESQQLTSKLTPAQLAVAIAVPIAVIAASLALAWCLRNHSRKQPAADGSSSTVLKDVESGLSQQVKDSFRSLTDSICRRKQLSNSSAADTSVVRVDVGSAGQVSTGHRWDGDKEAALNRQAGGQQLQQDAASGIMPETRQRPTSSLDHISTVATGVSSAGTQQLALRNDDLTFGTWGNQQSPDRCKRPDAAVSAWQAGGDHLVADQMSGAMIASPASLTSHAVSRSSVDVDVSPGGVGSVALTVSSGNNSIQQQQSGSLASRTSAQRQSARSSVRSRRLSFEDYTSGNDCSNNRHEAPDSVQALLKTRSDIAVLRDLKIGQLLGTGSYGRVYKGRWKSVAVAVKVMEHHSTTRGTTSSNAGKLVMAGRETAVASSMAHPNVVQTYHISTMTASQRRTLARTWTVSSSFEKRFNRHGRLQQDLGPDATDDNDDLYESDSELDVVDAGEHKELLETWLIMELCEKGSLEKAIKCGALRDNGSKPEMIGIYKALLDIASGLDYLHSMGVVHGDLKTANVLLKGSTRDVRGFACKITDFGLSRVLDLDATHVSTRTYGTITYMPKEVLMSGQVSQATDVYSFGLLMWELYVGCSVLEDGVSIGQIFYTIAYSDWRPEVPSGCPTGYSDLMKACWHQDPEQRPTAQQLLRTLQKLYAEAKQQIASAGESPSASKHSRAAYAPTEASTASPLGLRHWNRSLSRSSRSSAAGSSAWVSEDSPSSPSTHAVAQHVTGLLSKSQAAAGKPTTMRSPHDEQQLANIQAIQVGSSHQSRSAIPLDTRGSVMLSSSNWPGSSTFSSHPTSQPSPNTAMLGQLFGGGAQTACTEGSCSEPPYKVPVSSASLLLPGGLSAAATAAATAHGGASNTQAAGIVGKVSMSPAQVGQQHQQRAALSIFDQLQQSSAKSPVQLPLSSRMQKSSRATQEKTPLHGTRYSASTDQAAAATAAGATPAATAVGRLQFTALESSIGQRARARCNSGMQQSHDEQLQRPLLNNAQMVEVPRTTAATTAAVGATAASADSSVTASTTAQSTSSSDQAHLSVQQQQQQRFHRQLSSYYQLRNSFDQQPTLDNEALPSESLFAADGLQSTSTWQDYSSGGSTLVQDMSFVLPAQQQYPALGVESYAEPWQQQPQPLLSPQQHPILCLAAPAPSGYPTEATLAAQSFLEALEMVTRTSDVVPAAVPGTSVSQASIWQPNPAGDSDYSTR